jgi:hypothetical protein
MNGHGRQRSIVVALSLALMVALSSMAVLGSQPAPLIPVPKPASDGEPPAEEPAPEPDQPQLPEYDWMEDKTCLLGQAQAGSLGPQALQRVQAVGLAAYPQPIVPIEGPPKQPGKWEAPIRTCQTQLSLSLIVKSPKDRDPDGADAWIDGSLVRRTALESGYQATMPAAERTIAFSHPGDDWVITEVSCTCMGSSSESAARNDPPVGRLASYPGPVVAVGAVSTLAKRGSTGCGSSPSSSAVASAPSLAGLSAPTSMTAYPGPVVPVPGPPQKWDPVQPPGEPEPRNPGSVRWDPYGEITISDSELAGGAISCAWTVEHVYGDLKIRTITKPSGREGEFAYRVTPDSPGPGKRPVRLAGSTSGAKAKLWEGGWTAKIVDLDEAWEVTSSKCTETDGMMQSSAQGAVAAVGMDPSDKVTCTFKLKLRSPKPGPWTAANAPGWMTCKPKDKRLPSFTQKLRSEEDTGRIEVRKGGDKLIASGTPNRVKFTLHRDPEDLFLYEGTTSETFAGVKTTFKVKWRMIHEKLIEGVLSGKAKGDDAVCTWARSVVLRHGK